SGPHRASREQIEMFVVDLIEGIPLHDVTKVRVLKDEDAARREQGVHPAENRVQIRDVTDRVGGIDYGGRALGRGDLGGRELLEEIGPHPYSRGPGEIGDLPRRLDTEMTHTGVLDYVQHDPVVGADLHAERVLPG